MIEVESGADVTAGDGNPSSKLIRQILGAIAEFEKSVLVLKLRAARDRMRRETGQCEGQKPYGEKPGEAEVIEKILELRRAVKGQKRMSYADIAKRLNEEGTRTRYGGKAVMPEAATPKDRRLGRGTGLMAAR